jgi:hypothetical protein
VIISRIFTLVNPPRLLSSDLRVRVAVVDATKWVTIGVAAATMRLTITHLIQHIGMDKHQPKRVSRKTLESLFITASEALRGAPLTGVRSRYMFV